MIGMVHFIVLIEKFNLVKNILIENQKINDQCVLIVNKYGFRLSLIGMVHRISIKAWTNHFYPKSNEQLDSALTTELSWLCRVELKQPNEF